MFELVCVFKYLSAAAIVSALHCILYSIATYKLFTRFRRRFQSTFIPIKLDVVYKYVGAFAMRAGDCIKDWL